MAAEGIARIGPGVDLGWEAGAADRPALTLADPARLYDLAVLARLEAALDSALADPAVQAVVLDLAAPSAYPVPPSDLLAAEAGFAALALRIAAAPKPVVALIAGPVAGPLAALALAAALRVAAPGGLIGFPEVTLGLVPGAGATQRAARLAGAGPALALMLAGRLVPAAEAQAAGLIEMVTEAALPAARAAASALAAARAGGAPVPFARDPQRGLGDPAGFLAAVAEARARLSGDLPAPWQIVDCVEAALLLPEAGGLGFERAVFEALAATPEARALCWMAAAEAEGWDRTAAAPLPGPVAMTGEAAEGAAELLAGGVPVRLLGQDVPTLRATLEAIAARQEAAVAEGRMTEAARDAAWDRLSATTDAESLARCQIGIAADGSLAVLEGALPPAAVLGGFAWPLPGIGLQRHTPPQGLPLLEIATDGSPAALAAGLGLARAMGRVPLPCQPGSGALPGARLLGALRQAAEDLLLLGATPASVDAALRGFGFARGPFEAMDRAGLDHVTRQAAQAPGAAERLRPGLAAQLAAAGRTGLTRRRGFLTWPEGAEHGTDDPGVLALIAEERWVQGLPAPHQGGMGRAEICRLALAALANEGARMLSAGVAPTAGALDLLAGAVLGFPRPRGGPMHWAGASGGRTGLLAMRNALKAQAEALPTQMAGFWAPDPAWDRLIREGKRF
ncbi:3-hydroxyacyl-CoA dehydrogenase family protein [Frigidibacter sp.]|uniref:3-hydroxyacyl-CoA dehydrogenase family protein n=1 Tax=Frigidibacter sp. TaxID=2586418 RepID=UPI002736EB7C|nr:3-hydroxyacyl-CoA dehydrogenase family protein [Frigidibacter sp.]MDP3340069.1 3-hydroxyacyl-CoA dehydrogenase family protein [Frigidibacter sp.]